MQYTIDVHPIPASISALLSCQLCLTLLIPGPARAETISFVSDPSWQSFEMNPDGSRGAELGPAQCVCQVPGWPCYWGAGLSGMPGACWVWKAGVTPASPADLQGVFFSKMFTLSGPVNTGSIQVAVDDFAEVSVNGNVVGSTGSITDIGAAASAQSALRQFDLTPFLVQGANDVTVRAQNGPSSFTGLRCGPCTYAGNEAGLVFGGQITSVAPALSSSCASEVTELIPGTPDFGFGLFDTLQCSAVPEPIGASCLLGPPDLLMGSLGELGRVTLKFEPPIADGPGNDFLVAGSCNAINEPAEVLASSDGVSFVSIGMFSSGVRRFFDLAVAGLTSATYVRIQDLPGGVLPGGSGFDLDAVCALYQLAPVETKRTTWGQLKMKYR